MVICEYQRVNLAMAEYDEWKKPNTAGLMFCSDWSSMLVRGLRIISPVCWLLVFTDNERPEDNISSLLAPGFTDNERPEDNISSLLAPGLH